jgi:phospholipid/cholesterol/gamma-HCH transport system ATP-binding protein
MKFSIEQEEINPLNHKINNVPVLEFRNVSFGFEDHQVLSDISFKLNKASTLIITGTHQSGKSVLMRLAIGLMPPDEGEIIIEGTHIEKMPEDQLLNIRANTIGLVFQESALFTSLTVYDNVAFRLREQGWEETRLDPIVREILRFVNLDNSLEKYWEELSVGMRRRLEIARALAGWPPLMLFDEPTAGLDPINTKDILNLILGARDIHNVSSLYVTKELWELWYIDTHYVTQNPDGTINVHQKDEKHPQNTNVLVLKDGKLGFYGKPSEFEHSTMPEVLELTHPKGFFPIE